MTIIIHFNDFIWLLLKNGGSCENIVYTFSVKFVMSIKATPLKAKLVLLGDSRVGKSSIIRRLIKNRFEDYRFSRRGAHFDHHSVSVDNYLVEFEIWDTAGQEKYRTLAPLYYRGASAALVVYDITNRESFENARKWI
eukprot:526055_1